VTDRRRSQMAEGTSNWRRTSPLAPSAW
jgi:hypothetical protein